METVFLALGSNLGPRHKNLKQALTLLENRGIAINRQSSIIETDPVGGPEQGPFLNMVILTRTSLDPFRLLATIKGIESQMGRVKSVVNGARIIDIDILLYGSAQINAENLTIPHPRMWSRDFVLIPLKEIAADIFNKETHANR